MNLSNEILSKDDISLLDLGLAFIPTTNKTHFYDIETSLHKLTRSIKLRDYFGEDNQTQRVKKQFIAPNTWVPKDKIFIR